MTRVVVVTVGTSLLQKQSKWVRLKELDRPRQPGQPVLFEPDIWVRLIEWSEGFQPAPPALYPNMDLGAWQAQYEEFVAGYERWDGLTGEVAEHAQRMVRLCQHLWQSVGRGGLQRDLAREALPAELASLALLEPPLGAGDLIALLYSETAAGALCAAVLGQVLNQVLPNVPVEQRRVAGLRPDDLGRFETRGVGELAWIIADDYYFRRVAADPRAQLILNFTGGFKASIPILTQVAAVLVTFERRAEGVRMVALYEEAPGLLWQPLLPIELPGDVVHRVIYAYDAPGDDPKVGMLSRFVTADAVQAALLPGPESLFYTKGSGPAELTMLGRVMRLVLRAQRGLPRA